MGGRSEVSVISHTPVTRSDLKHERFFSRGSVSTFLQLVVAHKISQNDANIPELFQNYLVKVSDIHSHNTRYASNLNFHVPRVRSNYGKHIFKFAITKEIPTKIKKTLATISSKQNTSEF